MKAQYISTPGRAKKIIVAVWLCAIGLSVLPAYFVSGVMEFSLNETEIQPNQRITEAWIIQARFNSWYTDYIANDFLNLRDFRIKIGNLKWQIGKDIIQITVRNFVTLLVQKNKRLVKKTDL